MEAPDDSEPDQNQGCEGENRGEQESTARLPPLGAYAIVKEDLASSTVVVLIPISDEKAFLELLEKQATDKKITLEKGKDGVYNVDEARAELKEQQQRAKFEDMSEKQLSKEIKRLEKQMMEHAKNLEFEKAAQARDQLALLRERVFGANVGDHLTGTN